MLTAVPFLLPLLAGVACLALNRFVPTRWCAFGCAAALLAVAGVLVMLRTPSVVTVFESPWITLNEQP
ncbi:MAG TPA: hypothetical protein VFT99_16510, partial [Roseiflexaceae bacterium]|nr:hypothetical protein [Roseiflexaceae bacterium]